MSLHVIAVAESDSYLKWAVSLLAQLPASTRVEIVVASSPLRPSATQCGAALAGTAFADSRPAVWTPAQLRRRIERDRPNAVLLACTGPSADAYQAELARAAHRPVLIAGLPGIALPARRRAWRYRGAVDLFVVHSRREMAEYERVRMLTGKSGRVGLATLPFLAARSGQVEHLSVVGDRVLFATQAKVPSSRPERIEILLALDRLAASRPDLKVLVKTRGGSGEFHTHHEAHHYADLWRDLVSSGRVREPARVTFVAGSMAEQLQGAAALITVSSTAVLEAMALDLPVLLIDEFGVSADLINQGFVGSGCLGGLDALEKADFRRPQEWWMADNYFHPQTDNTWLDRVAELVESAAAGQLPPITEGLDAGRTSRRRRLDRMRLTAAGSALVRTRHRAKRLRRPR
ncbi:MAG TPA: DUF6716 putative glycosyltransferase [Kineosporiaceae bacterium]|nr:DUF6716 putative glycosyltransferase [Kineosporiaceae bacterium]